MPIITSRDALVCHLGFHTEAARFRRRLVITLNDIKLIQQKSVKTDEKFCKFG